MKYLYFKLYQALYNAKSKDTSAMNAMFVISILECINTLTLFLIVRHYLNIQYVFLNSKNEIVLFTAFFGITSYIVNYFVLYKNIGKIDKNYSRKNKLRNVFGFIGLIVYIFGSLYFAYLVGSTFPIK
ncbi:MAG: hypothetical protein WCJ61_09695 [Paludibacter sp.]